MYESLRNGLKILARPAECMDVPSTIQEHNMHAVGDRQPQTDPESGLQIDRRDLVRQTTVVAVAGELDLSSAPQLKWALEDVEADGERHLVVDLSEVSFIDSTALGVLVGAQRALQPGMRLAIVCAEETVRRIFELTGLDGLFEIVPTLHDALGYVQGSTTATT